MKTRLLIVFLFLALVSNAQYIGKLIIYTTIPEAAFIPYINDEKQTMVPIDTFETELVNVEEVEVLIDFADTTAYDIQLKVNFATLKNRVYRIEYNNEKKWKKEFKEFTNRGDIIIPTNKNAYDKYLIKRESLKTYINKINE